MKIATIVGARPQFVKAAVVSRALQFAGCKEVLIHTGQHYDSNMSDVFFEELGIPAAAYNLGVGSGPHGMQTGHMLEAIEPVLVSEQPEWVIVYGDTNSTLAGALAAVKLQLPVAHVEAGLRSWNRSMPEEINRVLTDHAADLLFAPTPAAAYNLRQEGIRDDKIRLVGDVMYDAALHYGRTAENRSEILAHLHIRPREYVLATVHRAENTDSVPRMKAILSGIVAVCDSFPVVFPLHPRTRKVLMQRREFQEIATAVRFIEPVGFFDMLMLEKNARLIVSDSGGVQKEAFFHGVPCVTLRDETEWVELIEIGWNRLAPPTSAEAVSQAVRDALGHIPTPAASPYGDGDAAGKIVRVLQEQTLKAFATA